MTLVRMGWRLQRVWFFRDIDGNLDCMGSPLPGLFGILYFQINFFAVFSHPHIKQKTQPPPPSQLQQQQPRFHHHHHPYPLPPWRLKYRPA